MTCSALCCMCRGIPLRLVRFGLRAGAPATMLARAWQGPQARALFGGVAAHAYQPAEPADELRGRRRADLRVPPRSAGRSRAAVRARSPLRSRRCWPSTAARSRQACACARWPSCLRPTPSCFDLAPAGVVELAGDRLPARVARAYRRYRHGPGAFKVDLAVEGGIPWTNEACRRAGTVHAGGTFEEIVAAERTVNDGRMPERPFVLVAQQYLADPERSAGDVHPVWAYAHVPSGYDGDATEALLAQIERFAPGVRERIVATAVTPDRRDRRAQRELHRRRHHHGREHAAADADQAAPRARPVQHGHSGRLHLLSRDAARRGRARDERLQRRAVRAEIPARAELTRFAPRCRA